MSGKTLVRALTVVAALVLTACATTAPNPATTQSLLDNMRRAPAASEASCAAANMALVCQSAGFRASGKALTDRCACADRNELRPSSWR